MSMRTHQQVILLDMEVIPGPVIGTHSMESKEQMMIIDMGQTTIVNSLGNKAKMSGLKRRVDLGRTKIDRVARRNPGSVVEVTPGKKGCIVKSKNGERLPKKRVNLMSLTMNMALDMNIILVLLGCLRIHGAEKIMITGMKIDHGKKKPRTDSNKKNIRAITTGRRMIGRMISGVTHNNMGIGNGTRKLNRVEEI